MALDDPESGFYVPTPGNTKTFWWLIAMVAPYAGWGIGIILVKHTPHETSDWLGGAYYASFLKGWGTGMLTWLICTIRSHYLREKFAGIAYFGLFQLLLFFGMS